MRFSPLAAALLLLAALSLTAAAGDGIVDLTRLANYAAQPFPPYITRNNTPGNNPITDKGATLGRILFYDRRLSRDDSVSCSTCHQQSRAFSAAAVASTGVNGTTGRHSMRLVNARFSEVIRFFWDRRATSLENQTTQPIRDHVEMGFSGANGDPAFATLVTKLSALDDYRVLFIGAFGDATITEARIQFALAQFVRSIQSFDSRFDDGRAATGANGGNYPNFTAQENAGKALFLNPPPAPGSGQPAGAGCAGCHRPPEFDIAPNSRNNGVIGSLGGGTDLTNTRSPSLRDLLGPGGQSNGPFMHDGSHTVLADVINHYDLIPANNANLDPRLQRPDGSPQSLGLSQAQKNSLAAFLATLTGTALYTDARWSDPFTAQGQLALIVLPAEAISVANNGNGTAAISCRAVPGLQFQLRSSTDLVNWTLVTTVTPNASGVCTQTVSIVPGTYYRYAYIPPAARAALARTAATPTPAPTLTPASAATPSRLRLIPVPSAKRR